MKMSNLLGSGKIPEADQNVVSKMPQLVSNNPTMQVPDAAPGIDEVDMSQASNTLEISLHQIDISPFQPRIIFDSNELQCLADSIALGTLIDPITVRQKEDGRYELISGERRYRAHQILGYKNIPAVLKILDDKQSALLSIASNTVRENLTDFELGMSFKKLLDNKYVKSVVELARYVGISRQQIDRCLDFSKLPSNVIKMLEIQPNLFGANCAEFLAGYMAKGFEDNVTQAVDMIANGATEQKAMFWLKNQCGLPIKRTSAKKKVDLFFKQKHFGDAYIEKNKVIIQCNSDSKPSEILKNIHEYFSEKS